MNYSFNDYEFEFIYNPDDLVISCHYQNKLWQDVFTIQEIKKQNFNDISNVNTFIDKCFDNHNINIQKSKEIKLGFFNESNKLTFTLLPIRKNSSSNQEILDLKRELKNCKKYIETLENKFEEKLKNSYIENNFYMNPDFNGLSIPYKFNGGIIFTSLDNDTYRKYKDSCFPYIKTFLWDTKIEFDKEFKKLNISKLFINGCNIVKDSMLNIPKTVKKIILTNCCLIKDKTSENTLYFPDTVENFISERNSIMYENKKIMIKLNNINCLVPYDYKYCLVLTPENTSSSCDKYIKTCGNNIRFHTSGLNVLEFDENLKKLNISKLFINNYTVKLDSIIYIPKTVKQIIFYNCNFKSDEDTIYIPNNVETLVLDKNKFNGVTDHNLDVNIKKIDLSNINYLILNDTEINDIIKVARCNSTPILACGNLMYTTGKSECKNYIHIKLDFGDKKNLKLVLLSINKKSSISYEKYKEQMESCFSNNGLRTGKTFRFNPDFSENILEQLEEIYNNKDYLEKYNIKRIK